MVETSILLDAGTNELEILEFIIDNTSFGVNVMKIREVVNKPSVTKIPQTHKGLDGVFFLREQVIPLINLRKIFDYPYGDIDLPNEKVIVTELNQITVAFLVDNVTRIYRVSWKDIIPPPKIAQMTEIDITGIATIENNQVMMLDFEKVISDLAPVFDENLAFGTASFVKDKRSRCSIGLAEDSILMRAKMTNMLQEGGYTNLKEFTNGQLMWDYISDNTNPIFDIIITDIEMPEMDGMFLCKSIRNTPRLENIPVIIYSSLISEDNRNKAIKVGANAQISKPEIGRLIDTLDELMGINQ